MPSDYKEKITDNKDIVRNVFIAATSTVPVVGGVLSFFLDKYLPSSVETRKDLFLTKVEQDLERIPEHIMEQMYDNPQYHTVMLKVFKQALEDYRIEKINAFRNILINAIVSFDIPFDEQTYFIKLTTDLTIDQIRILHLFYLRDYKKTVNFGEKNNVYDYIKENWCEVDESYRFALVTEIMRTGLVTSSEKIKREKGDGHQLSPLGERFIEYVFTPIEIDCSD